jgi:hypothetical protein
MATTTKTLTPTNQTITLPDMTERPDASVLVDGIGKDADAINALASNIPASIQGTVTWGNNIVITRSSINHTVLVMGGRDDIGFSVYIPTGTNEKVILSNINSAISTVTVNNSTITIATKSSGYGSNINYTAIIW